MLVDQPSGVEHMQSILHHHSIGVGNFFLSHLFVSEQFAFGATTERALTHHIDGAADHANRPHRVVHTATTQTCLSHVKSLSLVA